MKMARMGSAMVGREIQKKRVAKNTLKNPPEKKPQKTNQKHGNNRNSKVGSNFF